MRLSGYIVPLLATIIVARGQNLLLRAINELGTNDTCPAPLHIVVELQPVYYSEHFPYNTIIDPFHNGHLFTVNDAPTDVRITGTLSTTITGYPAATTSSLRNTGTSSTSASGSRSPTLVTSSISTAATSSSSPALVNYTSATATSDGLTAGQGIPAAKTDDLPADNFVFLAFTNKPLSTGPANTLLPRRAAKVVQQDLNLVTAASVVNLAEPSTLAGGLSQDECDSADPFILRSGRLMQYNRTISKYQNDLSALVGFLSQDRPDLNRIDNTFSIDSNGTLSWVASDTGPGVFFSCDGRLAIGFEEVDLSQCVEVMVVVVAGQACLERVQRTASPNRAFVVPTVGGTTSGGPLTASTTVTSTSTTSTILMPTLTSVDSFKTSTSAQTTASQPTTMTHSHGDEYSPIVSSTGANTTQTAATTNSSSSIMITTASASLNPTTAPISSTTTSTLDNNPPPDPFAFACGTVGDPCGYTGSCTCYGVVGGGATCFDYTNRHSTCGVPCDSDSECSSGEQCLRDTYFCFDRSKTGNCMMIRDQVCNINRPALTTTATTTSTIPTPSVNLFSCAQPHTDCGAGPGCKCLPLGLGGNTCFNWSRRTQCGAQCYDDSQCPTGQQCIVNPSYCETTLGRVGTCQVTQDELCLPADQSSNTTTTTTTTSTTGSTTTTSATPSPSVDPFSCPTRGYGCGPTRECVCSGLASGGQTCFNFNVRYNQCGLPCGSDSQCPSGQQCIVNLYNCPSSQGGTCQVTRDQVCAAVPAASSSTTTTTVSTTSITSSPSADPWSCLTEGNACGLTPACTCMALAGGGNTCFDRNQRNDCGVDCDTDSDCPVGRQCIASNESSQLCYTFKAGSCLISREQACGASLPAG